jgi:hypothetical protein
MVHINTERASERGNVHNKRSEESFLEFTLAEEHHSEKMVGSILSILYANNLNAEKLCGQGAANMSGTYGDIQVTILEQQQNEPYVHCGVHNLNLFISYSIMKILEQDNFYELLDLVYIVHM